MNDFAANNEDVSEDVLEVAILLTQTVDGDGYAELAQSIATQLALRNDPQRALDVAETIADPYLKDQTLGLIAAQTIDSDEIDSGELLDAIEDPVLRDLATEQVAVQYAATGDIENSLALVSQLPDNEPVLSLIAVRFAANGFETQSLEVLESIENPATRVAVSSQLSSTLLKQGKTAEAESLVRSAESDLSQIEYPEERINAALNVASVLRDLNRNDEAFEHLKQAGVLCKEFEESDAEALETVFVRDESLAQIASEMAHVGHLSEADSLLEDIGDAFQFARATVQLALAHHKNGNLDESLKLLKQSHEITADQPTYGEYGQRMRDTLLAEIAAASATCGFYEQALELPEEITDSDEKLRAIIRVAQTAANSQQDAHIKQASDKLRDEVSKASFWLSLSESFRANDQSESFADAMAQSIDNAKRITMPYEQSLILAEIGLRLAESSPEKADSVFLKAVENLRSIESGYRRVAILLNLSQKYWKLDRQPGPEERVVFRDLTAHLE
jgi:tetratricopeptide (TPR) repeat protein